MISTGRTNNSADVERAQILLDRISAIGSAKREGIRCRDNCRHLEVQKHGKHLTPRWVVDPAGSPIAGWDGHYPRAHARIQLRMARHGDRYKLTTADCPRVVSQHMTIGDKHE
jgi:hypothetical protein